LRVIALLALGAGLVIRVLPLTVNPDRLLTTCDGRAYYTLALSWAQGKGLFVDDPVTVQACLGHLVIGPSHHFAPALAIIEGTFMSVMGATTATVVVPLLLISLGAVVVAWWTTRDLFGGDAGLLVGAAVSLEWTGVFFGTWHGYSENLVVIAFTLTMWAILKALRDDRYLLLAGLFAGVGYLSKASIGWFFLLAGLGGLVWRVMYRGAAVLRNRWYLAAIAVFAIPVLIWSYRNISLFWDGTPLGLLDAWQTSEVQARFTGQAFQEPVQLLVGLVGKLPILLGGLLLPFLPLLPGFRDSVRRWKEEDVSGLWLSVALVFVLGWFFAGAFWVVEQTSLLWGDPIRYVAPAQIPLLWLLVRSGGRASTIGWALSYAILLVMALRMNVLLIPGDVLGP
jgi:4-amino-4-deoxy-L-arabinose transferase-like glycosyltransferase